MLLANSASVFTREHCQAHRGNAPGHLCELVVYCLELVSQLGYRQLPFRFKGGNSLLVLLGEPWRYSIDVDIVSTATKEALSEVVADVVAGCEAFERHEVRPHKTKPWLPMISFKLFYRSAWLPPEESFVMLDAVLEPAPYPGERRPVRCGDVYASDVRVEVPTVSGLIGDKLLTLGPATLGIPLGKGKEAQRLKHVFDVALLSRQVHRPEAVRQSVFACMEQENRIQRSDHQLPEVIDDTRRFLAGPLEHAEPPDPASLGDDRYLYEIAKGFEDFRQHVSRVDYTWEMLRDDCRQVLGLLGQLD